MAAISQACSPVRWGESTKDGLDAVQEKVHLGLREFSGAVRENPLVERHDSGDVRNRVSWRASDSCWQAGIARSVGPADVGRHWNANHSRDPASIESVTLNDHDRSPESRTGSRTAAPSQPTRPRPAQSPLGLLQNPTARGPDEFIGIRIHFGAHSAQRFGHFVRRMTRDIVGKRCRIDMAAGPTFSTPQPLSSLEQVVRNRYGNFHTCSNTGGDGPDSRQAAVSPRLRPSGVRTTLGLAQPR